MSYDVAGARAQTLGGGLRPLLESGRVSHGGWCMIPSAFATEMVSASGCDWLCLDLQHGLIADEEMRVMLMAAAIRRTPVLVRVPVERAGRDHARARRRRRRDHRADGQQRRGGRAAVVAAARYPPMGYRSWGPLRSLMGKPGFDPAIGNRDVVCLVMIETLEAFEQLDAILAVAGVDGVFVGPNDLSISHTGATAGDGDPERDAGDDHARSPSAAATRGLAAGITCTDGADAQRRYALGYTLLGLPSDAGLLGQAMTEVLGSGARRAERMKLGLITTGILQHDFEAGLDLAARLGFECIEVGCARLPLQALRRSRGAARRRRRPRALARGVRRALARDQRARRPRRRRSRPTREAAARYGREFDAACRLAERIGVDRLTLLAGLPEGAAGDRTPTWVTTPFPPWNVEALRVAMGAAGRPVLAREGERSPPTAACGCASR